MLAAVDTGRLYVPVSPNLGRLDEEYGIASTCEGAVIMAKIIRGKS